MMEDCGIKVGDMVLTGVYVDGKWCPGCTGRVVRLSIDGAVADVDVMSHHGGRPWILCERTSNLRPQKAP